MELTDVTIGPSVMLTVKDRCILMGLKGKSPRIVSPVLKFGSQNDVGFYIG